ncbi:MULTISPECIES: hypothetical protein [Enterobacteriaceae]|uniref:hypothetical protein n=1 Tax=Enterobacteriaceae TaxID=543 RepID=UPI001EE1B35C|nr:MULTISPECIES: hypothetical protein [Enterobacteriaceae]MCZ3383736.1 hypothetical protein [Kosakonia sp. SOY2]
MRRSQLYLLCVSLLLSFALTGCVKSTVPSVVKDSPQKQQAQQCYEWLTALKGLDKSAFQTYTQQFKTINNSYEVYKKNQPIIDKNAAEIMKTEIDNKVEVVCSRVRSAVFANMSSRANTLKQL